MLYLTEAGEEVFLCYKRKRLTGEIVFTMLSNDPTFWNLRDCERKLYDDFKGRYTRGWYGTMEHLEREVGKLIPAENEE